MDNKGLVVNEGVQYVLASVLMGSGHVEITTSTRIPCICQLISKLIEALLHQSKLHFFYRQISDPSMKRGDSLTQWCFALRPPQVSEPFGLQTNETTLWKGEILTNTMAFSIFLKDHHKGHGTLLKITGSTFKNNN
jgi:hypothetical protein